MLDLEDDDEAAAAAEVKWTCMPCEEDVRIHNLTHLPFRDWCPYCVQGRGVSAPHKKGAADESGLPVISMDYMGMVDKEPDVDENPTIVLTDRKSKAKMAHVLPRKGVDAYAVRRIVSDITKMLGYSEFILKSDQEPAILALKNMIKQQVEQGDRSVKKVVIEESPVGESQSNGDVENAIKEVQGHFRTVKAQVQARYKTVISEAHPILTWLVTHVSRTIYRYKIGPDGKTPRQRVKGKLFSKHLVEFGETVWYLKPKSKMSGKYDTRWSTGIWLGIREESGEVIIGTDEGCIKCRTIRRKSSDAERYNVELFMNMKGVPWEPEPGRPGIEIRTKVRLPTEELDIVKPANTVEREKRIRRARITPEDIRELGDTPNCKGCEAIRLEGVPIKHNEECRDRVMQELGSKGDPRVMDQVEKNNVERQEGKEPDSAKDIEELDAMEIQEELEQDNI